MSNDRTAKGFAAAIASAVVLAFTGIVMRLLTRDYGLPVLVLAFWRNLLTAGCLALGLCIAAPALLRVGRRHWGFLAVLALVQAAFNTATVASVAHAGAALSTILIYSSSAFTVVLGRIFLKERVGPLKVVAVVLSLSGCALVALGPPGAHASLGAGSAGPDALGMVTGVVSGAAYAVYSLMGRAASRRGLSPFTTVLYSFGGAAVVFGAVHLAARQPAIGAVVEPGALFFLGPRLDGWLWLLVLSAGPTLLGFVLYNVSLSLLASSTANLVLALETPVTAVVAWALLDERLTSVELWGGALVVWGVVVLARSETGRRSRRVPPPRLRVQPSS